MLMMAEMSRTTAVESRWVTVCQCRSMKTKATTDCSTTIGTIMMSSERAYRRLGMRFATQPDMRRHSEGWSR